MPPRLPDRRSRSRPRPQFLLLPLLLHRRHYWFLLLTLALLLLLLLVHAAAPPRSAAPTPSAAAAPRGGGRRSFEGVMEAVEGNKRGYAARMGYDYVDARGAVDPRRPPSWSKILAVRSLLPSYDWVFWNDADTVITNPNISLESILLSAIGHSDFDASPDLVVTEDFGGINAGVWLVRRSAWSERFLEAWWNATSFVRLGSTRSGDNAAMQHLIAALSAEESRAHVRVSPMQCLFNSYPWTPTPKSLYRLIVSPAPPGEIFVSTGAYSDGDFMVHLAGIDDKKRWTAKILQEMMSTS
uniref:Alpha-1,6-mannosyltransferase MNN10 n=1 Tax=Ananas comosus var. bracteatus TaxID=296719 RepID=A0A6V7QLU7_ANACO|nr:unnamed protein product [Ananas comosus var. bracteatus]